MALATSNRPASRSWAEPLTEAAQCLASMSSSSTTATTTTTSSAAASNHAAYGDIDAPAETDPDIAATATTAPRAPRSKPARLSLACNPCRKRKVRCDAKQPKCHNCTVRQDVCITSDPRRPGAPLATRKRATRRQSGSAKASADQLRRDEEQGLLDEQLVDESVPHLPARLPPSPVSVAVVPLEPPQQPQQPSPTHTRSASFSHAPVSRAEAPLPLAHHRPSVGGPTRDEPIADPGSVRTHASNASSNRNASTTTRSQNITWLSRAYQEISEEHGRPGTDPEQPDPTAVTPDVVVNTDGSPNRSKVLGGSSLQCLFNFADLWLAGYGFDATAPLFRHGLSMTEEFSMPLLPTLPDLPSQAVIFRCIDAYADRIWPLFPIISREALQSEVEAFLKLQNDTPGRLQTKVHHTRIPNLAVLYAILCIGMNETRPGTQHDISPEMRDSYLTACYSLHAHLTAAPYQTSVQALLLIALSLRGCGKDGQSWYMSGQAVRLALSLGLHKTMRRQLNKMDLSAQQRFQMSDAESSRRRLWGACFSLEMLLQLESGRPSSIGSAHIFGLTYGERGTPIPEEDGMETGDGEEMTFFTAWVSLASIMGQISDRLYSQHRFNGAVDMLGQTARLARSLSLWEAALPESLKPHNESDGNFVMAVFLAQQFHHAQIAVSRTAMVFPHKGFRDQVETCSAKDPEIKRLLGSATLCVNASRSSTMQALQLADAGVQSVLISVPQIFLASVVLAISILRAPNSRLARFDGELLTSATAHVESCYQAWGYPPAFLSILTRLRERAGAVLRGEVKLRAIESRKDDVGNVANGSAGMVGAGEVVAGARNGLHVPFQPQAVQRLNDGSMHQFMMPLGMGNSAYSGESGVDAFSMEFEDVWNMLDTDMFMYDMGDRWDQVS
ncbi:hypothetical protein NLU13_6911 [Sarocladium strictum]|uniref:Zn(2)-C6 fungal-type domain-containing protein n=1 Tax=Sarocladium strictum TaxID=5046 RepID=A0AA39GFS5_SARSR|nr:hypothetical protein NLU13_6911 [Sarocladium strictum]